MLEFLASMMSLPNIHPVVVHFPIALAFTALAVEVPSSGVHCRSTSLRSVR